MLSRIKNKVLVFFNSSLLVFSLSAQAQNSSIKRRCDSFFGVHFDFHASMTDKNIGGTLTPEMVTSFLNTVKPDFIEVDTKGHPGISSYPTKVGVAAPGIVKDPLRVFRDATASMGVALYSHFSGVRDQMVVTNHPAWARVNADGHKDTWDTSLFDDYADQYFIPQIEELSKNYCIDGVWVDGECWAVQPDFSSAAKAAYKKDKGGVPAITSDYIKYTRQEFHKYLAHYTSVLHQYNPKLQIASNWAYSSYMPGPVDADVDFLSGDIVTDDDVDMEFEPRVIAAQGKPWDLMTWGFMGDKNGQGHFWKSALHLEQKASMVLSQGGGFQVYLNQNRDASIPLDDNTTLKQIADFCRARQPYCFKAKPIPQIALVYSGAGHDYDLGTNAIFNQTGGGNDYLKGALSMLLDSQLPVQVLQEHNLSGNMSKYPLIIISEWNYLDPAFVSEVKAYVQNGGKLITIGGTTSYLFNAINQKTVYSNNNPAKVQTRIGTYGKGTIASIDANISLNYLNNHDDNVRKTVIALVNQLFTGQMVTVTGSNKVHVSLTNSPGSDQSTLIHLVNVSDQFKVLSNNQLDFQMAATSALKVSYKCTAKPSQVLLQPGNKSINFTYANGVAQFNIPGVDIYSIIQVDQCVPAKKPSITFQE